MTIESMIDESGNSTFEHGGGDFGENDFGNSAGFFHDQIQRTAVHEFHADRNLTVVVKGTVETWNKKREIWCLLRNDL